MPKSVSGRKWSMGKSADQSKGEQLMKKKRTSGFQKPIKKIHWLKNCLSIKNYVLLNEDGNLSKEGKAGERGPIEIL